VLAGTILVWSLETASSTCFLTVLRTPGMRRK
jgi:hypothetical protein